MFVIEKIMSLQLNLKVNLIQLTIINDDVLKVDETNLFEERSFLVICHIIFQQKF